MRIEPMVFVDDIGGAGDAEQVNTLKKNCEKMEKKKKMTFNNKKSKLQVISYMKKKGSKLKKINACVKKGTIEHCEEYKYLGDNQYKRKL